MNAGAHARAMADVVRGVEVFRLASGRAESVPVAEAGFTYRRSSLGDRTVVIGARLGLGPGEPVTIRALMDEAREWRRATQPLAEPNCGSVFKNPPDDHAARLVEAAGLKGPAWGACRSRRSTRTSSWPTPVAGPTMCAG